MRRGGLDRLLWDCATVERVIGHQLPSAASRLESELGERRAGRLVRVLARGCQSAERIELGLIAEAVGGGGLQTEGVGVILPLHRGRSSAVVSPVIGRKPNRGSATTVPIAPVRAAKAARNKQRVEREHLASAAATIELGCECADPACRETVALTQEELIFLKSVPSYFAVSPGHVACADHVLVADAGRVAIVE